jgi:hypothetical protein
MGYWNEIDPKETKQIIQNERDTFHSRAQADAELEAQGRFKRQNETRITGSGGVPTYPAQPATSPWGGSNPIPPDPATDQIDYDPNFVEPVLPKAAADPATTESSLPVVAVDRVGSEPVSTTSALTETGSSHAPAASCADPSDAAAVKGGRTRANASPSAASHPSRKYERRF